MMDTLYRILTEATELIRIGNHVTEYFDGFTILTGTGYWKYARETSLVIEILGTAEDKESVLRIASWIKTTFKQESVAITVSPVTVYAVGKSL